ncbi:hypothetical protein D3H66_19230 [Citrobacter portucalensis]|uniref:Uncharacterized protein n=1 Tax=Citrobacter portucalensis TaxID=1639133 RepID=A0A5B0SWQ6_9ENTR|nr:hypothetical protein D3H66_19230 [Citrobacter portucalensis]
MPGSRRENRRCASYSSYSVCARIPAGSPGQLSTPHRFSAGPGSSLQRSDFQLNLFCCFNKKRRR